MIEQKLENMIYRVLILMETRKRNLHGNGLLGNASFTIYQLPM